MKINTLLTIINKHVPLNTAEDWDNVGLLIGNEKNDVTGILTALDCTEAVVDEAIANDINTIICHHPLIFKGVNNIIENDGYGAIIHKLIKNSINLIALHTNLDVYKYGVNKMLADKIGLTHLSFLNEETYQYYKVQVFVPEENKEALKSKLSEHGLASEGDYEHCFFESNGVGNFKPVGDANPHIGNIDEIEAVQEVKVEFMIESQQKALAQQLIEQYHPYETPVYDFITMTKVASYGLGIIGELDKPLSAKQFAQSVKSNLSIPSVRFTGDIDTTVQRVAIIGGSGIGFEYKAKNSGADIFITGDVKHHDALDAKTNGVNILDIDHYSEYVMKEGLLQLLHTWLSDEEISFSIKASTINTSPFEYL
ncbi:Nif3-like dinuclear metal center hexameric protein [Helicobacter pylori]